MEKLLKNMYQYFDQELAEGKIDFHVRAERRDTGIRFYIHPQAQSGDTGNYFVFPDGMVGIEGSVEKVD